MNTTNQTRLAALIAKTLPMAPFVRLQDVDEVIEMPVEDLRYFFANPTQRVNSQAVVPTAAGLTTGTILPGTSYGTVTSAGVNDIAILPAPVPGTKLTLQVGGTGFELRSSAPATVGINGGTGVNAESAIPANVTLRLECVSPTNWIAELLSSAGVRTVAEVAAP